MLWKHLKVISQTMRYNKYNIPFSLLAFKKLGWQSMQIMFKQKDKFCKVGYKTKCRTYEIPCFFHHRNSYPRRFLTFLSNDPILSKNFFTLSVPWNNNCLFQKTLVRRREHNEDWIRDFKNMGEQKIVLSYNSLIEK